MPAYFSFGVDLVWLVWIQRQVIEIHRRASPPQPFDPWEWRYEGYGRKGVLGRDNAPDGGAVLPGFSCQVSDLFA